MSVHQSGNSFAIPSATLARWQEISNILASIANVPAALIMQRTGDDIVVCVSSESEGNPYRPGEAEHFDESGLYCETTIRTDAELLVPNALEDEDWKNNPDVKRNMISYLGVPLYWPDRTPFGTICMLDSKPNSYSDLYRRLIVQFRDLIEGELKLLYKEMQLSVSVSRHSRHNDSVSKLFETLPLGAVFVSGEQLLVNAALERMTGYDRSELQTRDAWFQKLHRGTTGSALNYHAKDHTAVLNDLTQISFYNKQGDVRIGEFVMTIFDDREIWLVRDVTDAHRVAEELDQSYQSLKRAEEVAGIGSWILRLSDGQLSWSDNLYAMYKWDRSGEPPSLKGLSEVLTPDSYALVIASVERSIESGEPYSIELENIRRDGTQFSAVARGQVLRDEHGNMIALVGTAHDVNEQKQIERKVAVLNDRLQLAIRAGGVGIWESDLVTKTFLFNAQMHKIYGIETEGFRSHVPPDTFAPGYEEWIKVIHPDDAKKVDDAFVRAMAEDAVVEYEYRIFRPSGEMRYVRSAAQVVRDENGALVRAVGTTLDITAEREAEVAMREAKEVAESAERAKSEFLATMSHEIRTPMNTVLGMTRLTLQTELNPKQLNYLSKIDQSARTLVNIINDILDFSKIEAGKLELEQTEFTLESVLESVATVTAIKAEEKGLEIVFSVATGIPDRIIGDPLRLGQVLINLVNNAVKFTERGEIVVSISLAPEKDGNTTATSDRAFSLQFTVRDSGIGIDPQQIGTLFTAFTQADSHIARTYGGTGLGLAISRRIVEMMGGKIWVSSELGRGSTFSFTVPITVSDLVSPANSTVNKNEVAGLAGRRVLIVDDNESARLILSSMVNRFGMTTDVAPSGSVALELLRHASLTNHPFELVLMDWRMPEMDGLEAAQLIKSDPVLQHTPAVLMVTAYGREEILKRVEQLQLEGVLVKPVTDSVLFNTIADALGCAHVGRRQTPDYTEHHWGRGMHPRMPDKEALAKLAGYRVLVVDDNALNREVVSDFLFAVQLHVDTAVNGLDALRKLDSASYDVVLMDVHMPEMDGLTAAREIYKQPKWEKLPVIALTAQVQASDREASLAAGMTAHLSKPIDEAELYATLIEVLIPSTKHNDDVSVSENVGDVSPESRSSSGAVELPMSLPRMDIPGAVARLSGSRERVLRLMRGFLRDFSAVPDQMPLDIEAQRYNDVALSAHTIKSSAAYLGASALSQAAGQVERAAFRGDTELVRNVTPEFLNELTAVLLILESVFKEGEVEGTLYLNR